jgi:hypothetical protein
MAHLEQKHNISRRTLQRTRAKLARLGLIEHISPFNTRYGGASGWRLSTRFAGGLRRLAQFADKWQRDRSRSSAEKEQALITLLDHHRRPSDRLNP